MADSPNMNLPIPVVGSTPGPEFASDVNDCLLTVDAHDHTAGSGVRVPTAGINVNADLPLNGYAATLARVVSYSTLLSTPADTEASYSKNGELAWKDKAGNEVILTNNGSVAGATGSIANLTSPAGATYSNITKSVTFFHDTNKTAKINVSDITLYKFNDTSGNGLTIKWAPASPVAYALILPDTLPTTDDSVAKTDLSGVQSFNAYGIVPVGGIVAIASHLTGAFPIPTTGTSSRGWQLCDGSAVEAGGVLSGSVPQLTDNRFLMGSTAAGATGGSNTATFTGTQALNHEHNIAHTHIWAFQSSLWQSRVTADKNSTSMTGTTNITGSFSAGGTGSAVMTSAVAQNVYTTGVIDPPTGSAGINATSGTTSPIVSFSNAVLNGGNNRPAYLSCVFLIRIK